MFQRVTITEYLEINLTRGENMQTLAIVFGVIAGCSLAAISLRWHFTKGLPIFGNILSPKIHQELDAIDKRLAVIAGIAFLLCILMIVFGS